MNFRPVILDDGHELIVRPGHAKGFATIDVYKDGYLCELNMSAAQALALVARVTIACEGEQTQEVAL